MFEWETLYEQIKKAIDDDDIETADRLLKEQDVYLRKQSFEQEELARILVEHRAIYEMLAQRKDNIQDLLMEQNNAQKVAKKYSDD